MRIATFNANSIRSRMPAIIEWLAENNPDILCVQETKVQDSDFPASILKEHGYNAVFKGEKTYNGVAVLSRIKPSVADFGLDDKESPDPTRLAYAGFGNLHVVNTYVPQGREIDNPMYKYKLEWFKRLKKYFSRRFTPDASLVWLGDMNVAPEPIDIHNADRQENHVCYHHEVRRAFADVISWGFIDVFRKHHPEPGQYSFFDYRTFDAVRKQMGWRVDHILCTMSLAARSQNAFIDLEPRLNPKPSDHTFVVADFRGRVNK